jgi:hypothetical protein
MTDYSETLKKLEEATKAISDETLRRIAFERLLEHELSGDKARTKGQITKDEPEGRVARPKRPKSRGSGGNPNSNIREEVNDLRLSPDEEGLPPWAPLGALDKYLWILEAAHKKNIDGLSCPETSALIYRVFRENHKPEQVANLKTRIKIAHVQPAKIHCGERHLAGYQILRGGIDHLKKLGSKGPAT